MRTFRLVAFSGRHRLDGFGQTRDLARCGVAVNNAHLGRANQSGLCIGKRCGSCSRIAGTQRFFNFSHVSAHARTTGAVDRSAAFDPVGSVAGDDTIIIVMRTPEEAAELCTTLLRMADDRRAQ